MSVTQPAAPLRVVIAEDAVLLREGLRGLLTEAGLDVAGTAGDAGRLLHLVELTAQQVLELRGFGIFPRGIPQDGHRLRGLLFD